MVYFVSFEGTDYHNGKIRMKVLQFDHQFSIQVLGSGIAIHHLHNRLMF